MQYTEAFFQFIMKFSEKCLRFLYGVNHTSRIFFCFYYYKYENLKMNNHINKGDVKRLLFIEADETLK